MSLMQRIPRHAKEVEIFKPASLADQQEIPSFSLKAPTRRQREDMFYAIRQDGLRLCGQDAMREATIDELCRLWECGPDDEKVAKVRAYWQSSDDHADAIEAQRVERAAAEDAGEELPEEVAPFEHPDHATMTDLFERLEERSPRLRRMGIGNAKYGKALPRYVIAHCVTGWTGLELTPAFDDEVLTIDSVFDLEDEFETRFGDIGKVAIEELSQAAMHRFFLGKDAEKNSESGPASQQTPSGSKATGSASPNGSSPESELSPETPAD